MSEKARKNTSQENAGQENSGKNEPGTIEQAALSAKQAEEIIESGVPPEPSAADYKAIIEDLNDKMLRAMAEAQNMRRRADIDIQNAKNFSTQNFAKDLLGVMDNLFSACEAFPYDEAVVDQKLKNIKDGIEITKREMINVFERNGIKRVEALGVVFDPNLHQAISQVADADSAPGTILQVLQAGYTLKDRLLRPSLVVVSKAEDKVS